MNRIHSFKAGYFLGILLFLTLIGAPSVIRAAGPDPEPLGVIDPRIELMFVVQELAGYGDSGLITQLDLDYKNEIDVTFATQKEHPAVKQFAKRMGEGFNFSRPFEFMLALSATPDLTRLGPGTTASVDTLGGAEAAETFRKALVDFARDAKFWEFYEQHTNFYHSVETRAREKLKFPQLVGDVEVYTGIPLQNVQICFMPVGHAGGFSVHVPLTNGVERIYALIGPLAAAERQPIFTDSADNITLIWHEFLHPAVNSLCDRSGGDIARSTNAFTLVTKAMKREGCGNWDNCVKESLVRCVVMRLTATKLGAESALAMRLDERRRGWIFCDELLPTLEAYESATNSPKTFADVMPKVIERLDAIGKAAVER